MRYAQPRACACIQLLLSVRVHALLLVALLCVLLLCSRLVTLVDVLYEAHTLAAAGSGNRVRLCVSAAVPPHELFLPLLVAAARAGVNPNLGRAGQQRLDVAQLLQVRRWRGSCGCCACAVLLVLHTRRLLLAVAHRITAAALARRLQRLHLRRRRALVLTRHRPCCPRRS